MTNKWLTITNKEGHIDKLRKDRIVAFSLSDQQIVIYIHTHVQRTSFCYGLDYPDNYGHDSYLSEENFKKLRGYLVKASRVKGELNLDPE